MHVQLMEFEFYILYVCTYAHDDLTFSLGISIMCTCTYAHNDLTFSLGISIMACSCLNCN